MSETTTNRPASDAVPARPFPMVPDATDKALDRSTRGGCVPSLHSIAAVSALSAIYFISTTVASATKTLWFDEIVTYQIARLPRVADVWKILSTTGTDVNPPLHYLILRASFAVLGVSEVAARVPSAIGIWVMCVCVYLFVRRRCPAAYAWSAVFLLLSSSIAAYATEARPYGVMMGFLGLALVSWQAAAEGRARPLASVGLAASMACAISCHYYAVLALVPLGLGELVRMAERRRIDWSQWVAFFGSLTPLYFYLPLIQRSRKYSSTFQFKPDWQTLIGSYEQYLSGQIVGFVALLVLVAMGVASARWPGGGGRREITLDGAIGWMLIAAAATLLALKAGVMFIPFFLFVALVAGILPTATRPKDEPTASILPHEIAVAIGFVGLPFLGLAIASLATKAYAPRYVFPTILGLGVLIPAVAAAVGRGRVATGRALAVACLIGLLALPSPVFSGLRTCLGIVRGRDRALLNPGKAYVDDYRAAIPPAEGADVVIVEANDYFILHFYADESIRRRSYFVPVGTERETMDMMSMLWGFPDEHYNIVPYEDFIANHREFLLLTAIRPGNYPNARNDRLYRRLLEDRVALVVDRMDAGRTLYRCNAGKGDAK